MRPLIITIIIFLLGLSVSAQVNRTIPPAADLPEKLNVGALIPVEVSNGMQVYLAPVAGYPKFTISVNIQLPDIENEERSEESRLLNDAYMSRLSTGFPNGEIDSITNFRSALLALTNSGGTIKGMKRDADILLGMFADLLFNPVISDTAIKKVADEYRRKQGKMEKKESVAGKTFSTERIVDSLVFGINSKDKQAPRELNYDDITVSDVTQFLNSRIVASNTVIVIVGNFTTDECSKLITRHFGDMPAGIKLEAPEKNIVTRSPLNERMIIVVDDPHAVQSTIRFVWSLEDAFTFFDKSCELEVMNAVFGNGQMSYLYRNLREDKGLCYFIRSGIAADARGGRGEIATNVRTSETALAIENVVFEMLRMRNNKVSEQDLGLAKNSLIGEFTRSLSGVTPIPYISLAMMKSRYNLPDDYLQNKVSAYYQVSSQDIEDMARKYIKPYECLIIVKGKASELEGTLEKFGDVIYLNSDGERREYN